MTSDVGCQVAAPPFAGLSEGLLDGIPISLSVAPWGIAYGLLAQQSLSLPQAIAMSGYMYSGTAQFVVLDMWQQPLAIGAMLFAVAAVNARYLLQGATLAPWLNRLHPLQRLATLFFLSDASWAMSLKRFERGVEGAGYLLGTSVAMYVVWVGSSIVGLLIPISPASAHAWGLDFAVAAALIALAGGRWAGRASLLPWLVAGAVALPTYALLGGYWYIPAGTLAGALAGAWRS